MAHMSMAGAPWPHTNGASILPLSLFFPQQGAERVLRRCKGRLTRSGVCRLQMLAEVSDSRWIQSVLTLDLKSDTYKLEVWENKNRKNNFWDGLKIIGFNNKYL